MVQCTTEVRLKIHRMWRGRVPQMRATCAYLPTRAQRLICDSTIQKINRSRVQAGDRQSAYGKSRNHLEGRAFAEARCWMAMRISSGSVRTPSLALS